LLVRGRNPALRSASPLELGERVPVPPPALVVVGVVVPGDVEPPLGAALVDGVIVVGVPGLTAPVCGALVPPGVSVPGLAGAPGVVVAVLVVADGAPGSVGVLETVIVLVSGVACVVVEEPPLSLTSAAARTPNASAAITARATIGALQFAGAARRVRAAAPQLRHHSCWGSSPAPHSGHAASTGGPVLGTGCAGGGAATALLNGSWRTGG
jgi:hypothetical protein